MGETRDIFSVIPRTKLKTFSSATKTVAAKTSKGNVVDVRNETKFIARLLAVGKFREIDFEHLMSYSLHIYPINICNIQWSAAESTKSKIVACFGESC